MFIHLVWFRSDLRLHDNLALAAACKYKDNRVLALFIATPNQWRQHGMAPRQAAFMFVHLNILQKKLAKRGIPLIYAQVSNFTEQVKKVCEICAQYKVTHLFYNYQYELNEKKRDILLKKSLSKVVFHGFDDSVILAPGSIMTCNNKMYKVFTSFKKVWLSRLKEKLPECVSPPKTREHWLDTYKTIIFDYPRQTFNTDLFPVSENAAINKLHKFCQKKVTKYKVYRDFPAVEGTSHISAYLALGILSPRQCLHYLLKEQPQVLDTGDPSSVWLTELIWREFYRHLIVYYPDLCKNRPFRLWTSNIQWRKDEVGLTAWMSGKTGYPIVDAAMRQLNTTGWMHNRLRMIAASFLVKDLLIDWRIGEHYFISKLIDGDLAANNGGWQWVASTGVDTMPYFRIFNPITQGQKFDSDGEFISYWLPELDKVPKKYIHDPWEWADKVRVILDYPRPIIKHKQACVATISAYDIAYKTYKNHDKK